MEQAAKNVDNFKTVLKNVDDFGKRVVTKIDDFGKQLDHLAKRVVISGAEELSAALRTADNAISEAARNFRLNIGLEPQLIDGFMPTPPPGKLSGLADNIQAFAKGLDEGMKGSNRFTLNGGSNLDIPNEIESDIFTGNLRGQEFELKDVKLENISYVKRDRKEWRRLRLEFDRKVKKDFLKSLLEDVEILKLNGLSDTDIKKLQDGYVPKGYQVHHQLPLDDSGTNEFDNLVLIKNEPYHKVITNYQKEMTKGMLPGDVIEIPWPIIGNNIYN
ncbi:hypothetical protein [Streptococcus suis]